MVEVFEMSQFESKFKWFELNLKLYNPSADGYSVTVSQGLIPE